MGDGWAGGGEREEKHAPFSLFFARPFFPLFLSHSPQLCTIFDVPIAIVSLVDRERQWFKSAQGLGDVKETDRRDSFCAWTLLPVHPEVLVVPDATRDARFARNPLVMGEPGIRFYAGAPLIGAAGARLGSLCVIDTRPRTVDAAQCGVLANFAEVVMRELEKEKARAVEAARLRSRAADLLRVMDTVTDCVLLVDVGTSGRYQHQLSGTTPAQAPAWKVLFANTTAAKVAGIDPAADTGRDFWELFEVADGAARSGPPSTAYEAAAAGKAGSGAPQPPALPGPGLVPPCLAPKAAARQTFVAELVRCPTVRGSPSLAGNGGTAPRFRAAFRPALVGGLEGAPPVGIPATAVAWAGAAAAAAAVTATGAGADTNGNASPADGIYFVTVSKGEGKRGRESAHRERGRWGGFFSLSSYFSRTPRLRSLCPRLISLTLRPSLSHTQLSPPGAPAASPPPLIASTIAIAGPEAAAPTSPTITPPAAAQQPSWDPLADVEVGLLIGQGAYGRVYRGMWAGSPVAVKVIPHVGPAGGPGPAGVRGALEALHAVDLAHPSIVQTYKSAQRTLVPRVEDTPGAAAAAAAAAAAVAAAVRRSCKGGCPASPPAFLGGAAAGSESASPGGAYVTIGADSAEESLLAAAVAAPSTVVVGGGGGGEPVAAMATAHYPRAPARVLTETWLVMEYCDRGNLQDAVDRGAFFLQEEGGAGACGASASSPPPSPLSPSPAPPPMPLLPPNMPAIVATAREIAAAMAYLHAQGILHGDLTGANVLLATGPSGSAGAASEGGRGFMAKVGDFGFARVLGGGGDASVSTGTYGTVTHCPPELLTAGRLSKAADVYAFGVLCWECYTGRRPWEGERMERGRTKGREQGSYRRARFLVGAPPLQTYARAGFAAPPHHSKQQKRFLPL